MPTYTFQNTENTSARRDNDDGSFTSIPWSTEPVEPLYLDSVSGRQWVEDGSPVPDPMRPPINPALDAQPAKTAAELLGVT
ncbi:hypothetical protein ABIF66_006969 [Bradyrhizobium japonicum]